MRIKALATLVIGLGLAGGASYLATDLTRNDAGAAQAVAPEVMQVVVARAEIAFGDPISRELLGVQDWPAQYVPTGVYIDIDALVGEPGAEPRRALGKIFPGELILGAKVSNPGERVTIVQKLTEGHRAMAISVSADTAVGGFVTPGDYVDLVLTRGSGDDMRTVTFLQNIRVVGVDQTAEEAQDQPTLARTLTVEVRPADAQRLALAQRAGTLSLSLRTPDAPDHEVIEEIAIGDLFAAPPPEPEDEIVEAAPVPVAAPAPRITIRRGTAEEEVNLR